MKISARNVLKGTVKSITKQGGTSEVIIEVADGVEVASVVSKNAIDELELEVGQEAYAVFDATSTMVGVSHHKRGE